jgi:hypothetical protein
VFTKLEHIEEISILRKITSSDVVSVNEITEKLQIYLQVQVNATIYTVSRPKFWQVPNQVAKMRLLASLCLSVHMQGWISRYSSGRRNQNVEARVSNNKFRL